MYVQDYRRLKAWQRSHDVAVKVYRATADFPAEERFGITAQIRRSAVSVPSNLAEGSGRVSDRDLARFVVIASGSVHELEAQLLLARDLSLGDRDELSAVLVEIEEVKWMIAGLLRAITSS